MLYWPGGEPSGLVPWPVTLLHAHDEHGTSRTIKHLTGDAAQEKALNAGPSVGAHGNQVGARLSSKLQDFLGRITLDQTLPVRGQTVFRQRRINSGKNPLGFQPLL